MGRLFSLFLFFKHVQRKGTIHRWVMNDITRAGVTISHE